MAILIIRLFEDHTKQALYFDDAGLLTANTSIQSLDEISDAQHHRLILLLPGTQVHMLTVKLPTMSATELQQAVPNTLEEQLTQDISDLYFAIGEADDDNLRHVAVMRKAQWNNLLDELKDADLTPEFIIPDYLALPTAEQSWSIYVDAETALVRLSTQTGFGCDPDLLDSLITLTLKESTEAPEKIHLYTAAGVNAPQLEVAAAENTTSKQFEALIEPLELLQNAPFNMLKRQFRKKRKKTQQRSYWYWCGVSFASLIAVFFLGQVALYIDFKVRSESLNKQLLTTYQRIIPGATALTESKFRTEELLKQYELSPNPFMSILQRIGRVKIQNTTISINSLNYTKAKVTLVISASTNSELNQFNQQLTNAGLKITSNQTNAADKKIIETITVEML